MPLILRLALVSGLILAAAPARRAAAEPKPVVVASVASVEKLLADVDALGSISQTAILTDVLKLKIGEATRGIDAKRPCGAVVFADGDHLYGFGFVPVTHFKQLVATVGAKESMGGIFEVQPEAGGQRFFIREHKGWACFGLMEHEDDLPIEKLPDDLSKLLNGQEKEYDVAVRGLGQNVPADWKKLAIEFIQAEMAKEGRRGREPADVRKARQEMEKEIAQWVVKLIEDTDRITLGWSVDGKGKRTYLDISMTTVPASPTAKMFAVLGEPTTSRFSGFAADEAAVAFQQTYRYPADLAAMMRDMLRGFRQTIIKDVERGKAGDDEDRILLKPLADCLEVLEDMYGGGIIDAAASIFLKPEAAAVVYGLHVGSGAKIEGALRDVAEWARKKYPDWPQPKFNADKYKDVRLHTLELPVTDVPLVAILGETTQLVVGTSDKDVYVAAGKDCMNQLKAAIDRSERDRAKEVLPMRTRVAAGPILEFSNAMAPNPVLGALVEAAAKYKGKDQLLVTLRGIDTGFLYRIELEEGLLALGGKAIFLFGADRR